jgi:hypothetical protein
MRENRSPILLLLLVVFFPFAAWARIGETLQECETRYGELIGEPAVNEITAEAKDYDFEDAAMVVAVTILNGKAVEIVFFRKDKAPLNDKERDLILEANKDFSWREVMEKDGLVIWETANKSRRAVYDRRGGWLAISEAKWVKICDDTAAKEAKATLRGY